MQATHSSPLSALLDLGRRVRHAESARELEFIAVNDSHALAPYRQAVLWLHDEVACLSGVVQLETNVPYVFWLRGICAALAESGEPIQRVDAGHFPGPLGEEWREWLPEHGLWLAVSPAADSPDPAPVDALLLARDMPWSEQEVAVLAEWVDIWGHAWSASQRASGGAWRGLGQVLRPGSRRGKRWWNRPVLRGALLLAVLAVIPVRLTVLAPGELVPAHPAVIRASLDGVIDTFHVQPNDPVKQGQPLFGFDEVLIQSRLDVARQALATAETEYRQTAQQALSDSRSKAQLAVLTGKIEEKRAEVAFNLEQLARARVVSPRDGVALFDDPSEWVGRPVSIGERIMRIAAPEDVEVEAWVPLADAIPLAAAAKLDLHLNASPLAPVRATLRYLAHDAVQRPDGGYAYRLRAVLDSPSEHRVGLKGTARLSGRWVPLAYWALRRPLASLRVATGW
ncbi:MAG: HlyD family efflux transporter periplasmic adaptor subunit [Pseudomonadota bacterium]